MSRYFTQFSNARPMKEISEAEATGRDFYAVELDDMPRRYRCFVGHELDRVVYPGWSDPAVPLADFRERREGVRGEIHTPPQRDENTIRWRTWYIEPSGDVERIVDAVYGLADLRALTAHWLGPDGALQGYHVHHYDEEDELSEVVTHAPDGTVTNRQRA